MGCDRTVEDLTAPLVDKDLSRPYLARFTFSPIQELIKASRKVRDFWSGSWLLHYLSAKVAYALAEQYGPDCLLYPSLYEQPLVDLWLLKDFPKFEGWIDRPSDRQLLTAGFPNVLVVILPKAKVKAAMQMARQTLLDAWKNAGREVFTCLTEERHWMPRLENDAATWGGWLDTQWQTYWSAVVIGAPETALEFPEGDDFEKWLNAHNATYSSKLFDENERDFLCEGGDSARINVGSWWAAIFDRVGAAVASAKNPRSWQLPTAFGPRSTISGLGPVVYPEHQRDHNWVTEGETAHVWKHSAGMFDDIEQLNATETLKRGLEKVLPKLLKLSEDAEDVKINADYPDLSSGVAGYLKCFPDRHDHYIQTCKAVRESQTWIKKLKHQKWGIPWIDDSDEPELKRLRDYPPRLLSPGWLAEDADDDLQAIAASNDSIDAPEAAANRQRAIEIRAEYRENIRAIIAQRDHYPNGSPADWYVLAVGDGDSIGDWLKGKRMERYEKYLASSVLSKPPSKTFEDFIKATKKRMGPATHNALSRSLLDFSGHLVPYLTEQRYAGRLIYCGGDDVLAYTNLWEWDRWLWDVRQCFRGDHDEEFANEGHYWRWKDDATRPESVPSRPLFTLGEKATISFGVVIAHHSVPLAIALGEMWKAEAKAKKHQYVDSSDPKNPITKDAVQVRVLYGNGNKLVATAKYDVLQTWQTLLDNTTKLTSQTKHALFEQAAALWEQHPAPLEKKAINAWTHVFCLRREALTDETLTNETRESFRMALETFIEALRSKTLPDDFDRELQSWLKLAAFNLRNRLID
jgi:CRISPR-associated protein Cmr2